MSVNSIYHNGVPSFLQECLQTPIVQRLQGVGMNCGCEYTAFSLFSGLKPYSRYDHSLGVALIIWHFTRDQKQAVAGLLHDVATPVFAHVVDFMRGDYLQQVSTEAGTQALIEVSSELQAALKKYGLSLDAVCDYHRYPIAGNDSPQLSADRLEYTIGNSINYGFCSRESAVAYYQNLVIGTDEKGQPELAFQSVEVAEHFAMTALRCSEVYVSDEDRYAMQVLSELIGDALKRGVIKEQDLYTTEPEVISKLLADEWSAAQWGHYRAQKEIKRADHPDAGGKWRKISAKKRYIDPLVMRQGRIGAISSDYKVEKESFLMRSQDYWLCSDEYQSL